MKLSLFAVVLLSACSDLTGVPALNKAAAEPVPGAVAIELCYGQDTIIAQLSGFPPCQTM